LPELDPAPGCLAIRPPVNWLFGFEHGDGLAASGVLIID
jgi:hypothetical protein